MNNNILITYALLLFLFTGLIAITPVRLNAQFNTIEVRIGPNITKPYSDKLKNPFLTRIGWNSSVTTSWEVGGHSTISAGINVNHLVFTEIVGLGWATDWPFNGQLTEYENTSSLYEVGLTALWSRRLSGAFFDRISPTIGFNASRLFGTVTTARVKGTGDEITLGYYEFPEYTLTALLGLQIQIATKGRHTFSLMPLYSYAFHRVKTLDYAVNFLSTYRPNAFSFQLVYKHTIRG